MEPVTIDLCAKGVGAFFVDREFAVPDSAVARLQLPVLDGDAVYFEPYLAVEVVASVSKRPSGIAWRTREIIIDVGSQARLDGRRIEELSFAELRGRLENAGIRYHGEYETVGYFSNGIRIGVWYDHMDKLWLDGNDPAWHVGIPKEITDRHTIEAIVRCASAGIGAG